MLETQQQIVDQALTFLRDVTESQYNAIAVPHFKGSIGAHMRHILDHYHALQVGLSDGYVNYNVRRRGTGIEKDPKAALTAWSDIRDWLLSQADTPLNTPLLVESEIAISETVSETVSSSFAREIVFVSSHAVHHFAQIQVIASLLNIHSEEDFGVAPATLTYLRQQA